MHGWVQTAPEVSRYGRRPSPLDPSPLEQQFGDKVSCPSNCHATREWYGGLSPGSTSGLGDVRGLGREGGCEGIREGADM